MNKSALSGATAGRAFGVVQRQPLGDRRPLPADEGDARQSRWLCKGEKFSLFGEYPRWDELPGLEGRTVGDLDPVARPQNKRFGRAPAIDPAAGCHADGGPPSEAGRPGQEDVETHAIILLRDDDREGCRFDGPGHPPSLGSRTRRVERGRP